MFVLKTTELIFCGDNFSLSCLCISFQLSCLVVNFLGHMLPSASSTEVDVGEGLDKNLNPIYRWLASSPSPDSLGYVTWRWLLNFSMPGLPHLFIETSLLRKLPAFLPSFTQHCSCCSGAQSCPTLRDPMDYSTTGFPVLHRLPELAQAHVH